MSSLGAIYERYAGEVRRFALYLSGSASDADDITAETFARALTGREIERGTVKAYLFTIARNIYRNERPRALTRAPLDESLADLGAGPEKNAADRESMVRLLRALSELPEGDRAAILMRGDDQMSHDEIAAALGISVTAAKVRIHRARVRLASLMETGG